MVGLRTCVDGNTVEECTPGEPTEDICDGLDNDCDGAVDEEQTETTTACGIGACAAEGVHICVDGEMIDTCTMNTPDSERCDELDNDCDGEVDENDICSMPSNDSTAAPSQMPGGSIAPSIGGAANTSTGGASVASGGNRSDAGGCSTMGSHHDVPIWLTCILIVGFNRRRRVSRRHVTLAD